jgi:DNA repair exonuclease SbcCD ATPase subunit
MSEEIQEIRNWLIIARKLESHIEYEKALNFIETLLSHISTLEERVEKLDLVLQSLTPGGSEFVNDPKRCIEYVKDIREDQFRLIKKFATERNYFESRLKRLQEAVDEHKSTPPNIRLTMKHDVKLYKVRDEV